MDLVLWRHAEAETGSPDAQRQLTGKGRKQAMKMAAWLIPRLKGDIHLLVSPTTRTRQTAQALSAAFDTSADVGPGATARHLLDAAGWPGAGGTVIIVGHSPSLNRAASLVLTAREGEWELKKGSIWWFQSREDGTAWLRAVINPKDL